MFPGTGLQNGIGCSDTGLSSRPPLSYTLETVQVLMLFLGKVFVIIADALFDDPLCTMVKFQFEVLMLFSEIFNQF